MTARRDAAMSSTPTLVKVGKTPSEKVASGLNREETKKDDDDGRYVVKATPMEKLKSESVAAPVVVALDRAKDGSGGHQSGETDSPRAAETEQVLDGGDGDTDSDSGKSFQVERSGLHEEGLDEEDVPALIETAEEKDGTATAAATAVANKTEQDPIPSFRYVRVRRETLTRRDNCQLGFCA